MHANLRAALRAIEAYDRARQRRDEAIRRAAADADSQRALARDLGMSHTRVQQILRGE